MVRSERIISFICAILCALSAGTAYLVSIYSTQIAEKYGYSTYEINSITVSMNYGNYLMGAVWGFIVDRNSKNPRFVFLTAAICLALGYSLVAATYTSFIPRPASYLIFCYYFFLIGFGSAASDTAGSSTA
jgi:fucose permease